ncbi:MAG TPA: HD domain-containing phosphohydrolase [Candidatus Wujingus californicus]|uniref:HD domain-containing phosphohydrolase n=1 Tax=Candidatus Wujingus californicus TaxID=3367618 RepID=UPI001DEE932A|nr:HD domain-containing protein [Planctomycetota bacterium]
MRISIVLKIFIAFIIVSLLPIAGYIAYNDWANRRIVYNLQQGTLMDEARKLARILDSDIRLGKERIKCINNEILLCNKCPEEMCKVSASLPEKERLKMCLESFLPSEQILVLDTKGGVVASNVGSMSGNNYTRRDFFTEAMKGITYVSEPNMEKGKGYIYYSTPIVNNKKDIYGVLIMRTNAEDIWNLIGEEKNAAIRNVTCILTDRYGVRIGHSTDKKLLFKSWVKLDNKIKRKLEKERHYGEDIKELGSTDIPEVSDVLMRKNAVHIVHSLAINNEKNYGYFVTLKEKDWRLGYTVPASAFFIQLNNLTRNSIFSTCIVVVIIVFATWFASTKFLRPIKRLNDAAGIIANGNLEQPIKGGPKDEIGELVNSFEIMRNKLKHSYKELEDAHLEAVIMLAKACEVRDEDTGKHVIRIRFYAIELAKEMGLDEEFIKDLGDSSILHDVGKIHIPDTILFKKPERLSREEMEEMKKHSLYGNTVFKEGHFFLMAREIAHWHHENWDGSGYPDKLKGNEIPISARIVRLADVYDALVMKRPYKDAWTEQKAYDEILKYSGIYFDPQIVKAFQSLFRKGIFQDIKTRFS